MARGELGEQVLRQRPGAAGGAATSPSWVFHRTRSDVTISAFKDKVDELLVDGLITKAEIVGFLAPQDADVSAGATAAATVSAAAVPTTASTSMRVSLTPAPKSRTRSITVPPSSWVLSSGAGAPSGV